ncbi:Exodeoxyribonuclease VII small subunit [Granulicatella balaenopterae]|uniref:Exodeoxyribonuclease 7 small subunit n=2 Tax=Granulicatella balaenopterae TaxID=137733 RepID=A0A1H9GQF7_9LACT|nr:Exodeoxyribonuclease VII small subunit [Granulicatella balaenopterae]
MMTKQEKSFEESLQALEVIVKQLEQGDVPLEDALNKFKEGIEISAHCNEILVKAEETVSKMMIKDSEKGE